MLIWFLRPFSTNCYAINDTFVKELRELRINTNNVVMASSDVKSLFTNIPLDETITIIVHKSFSNTARLHGFFTDQFTRLLNLALKDCHFLFNGVLYQQVEGVAIGSPLGPLLHFLPIFFYLSMKKRG